jgi:nucleotide-binding universal stress UspA family protein
VSGNAANPDGRTWTFVVGVDGSPASVEALSTAMSLGEPLKGRLVVVHVKHVYPIVDVTGMATFEITDAAEQASAAARETVERLLASYSGLWEFEERHGDPTRELLGAAREHDARLIVVGHRGHGRWSEAILGSVAARLTHHSPFSVLIVMPSARAAAPASPNV